MTTNYTPPRALKGTRIPAVSASRLDTLADINDFLKSGRDGDPQAKGKLKLSPTPNKKEMNLIFTFTDKTSERLLRLTKTVGD